MTALDVNQHGDEETAVAVSSELTGFSVAQVRATAPTAGILMTARPLSEFSAASIRKPPLYEVVKRGLDILLSVTVLIVLFPLYLLIALCILADSRGPILFKQKRLGLHGEIFWCYKFRTMVADAEDLLKKRADLREQFQSGFKLKNDPRITRVGAFLRKTSLDELPQFVNVLRGDITLIGPRPIVPPEIEKYGPFSEKLLSVRPGLSGLWQARGRSDTTYEQRVEMDMIYIDNRNMTLDIQLLFQTVVAVWRGRGAY